MSTSDQNAPVPATTSGAADSHMRYASKAGVSKVWVVLALVVGLAVGAAAAVGVTVVVAAKQPAPKATASNVDLSGTQWFAEDDTLPKGAAEPGTAYALGEAAKVLIGSTEGQSVARIAVDSVTALDAADADLLKSAQPALAGQKLFRIEYTVEFVSGDPLAGVNIGDAVYPINAEGEQLLRVPVSGWKKCGDPALPATIDASADGAAEATAAKMCVVAASPEDGADVVGALFAQVGGPYNLANTGQLTWLPAN